MPFSVRRDWVRYKLFLRRIGVIVLPVLFFTFPARAERSHRLGFGVRNSTIINNDEYFHIPNTTGITFLADVLNPFVEYDYDHYANIELGAIMQRTYGSNFSDNELDPVKPWMRLTVRPWKPIRVIFGDLAYPHDFYAPIVWELHQIVSETGPTSFGAGQLKETGVQVIYDDHGETWLPRNDFAYRYDKSDTPTMPLEKMVLEDVMQYRRGIFHGDYQTHWIHRGGEQSNPASRIISNTNDLVQMLGGGLDFTHFGFDANYFMNHHSFQYRDTQGTYTQSDGNGSLSEIYTIWGPLRVGFFYWLSTAYYHEDMNPVYARPNLFGHSVRWVSMWRDGIRTMIEYAGYTFQGAGSGGSTFLPIESSLTMKVSWEFHFPILEWKTQDAPPIAVGPDFRTTPAKESGDSRVFDDYYPKR